MTQEEFLKAVQNERSFIKRLLKSKAKRERAIKRLIQERFAHLFGKFCKVDDKFYYIIEVYGRTEGNGVKLFVNALLFSSVETMFKDDFKTLEFGFKPYYLGYNDLLKAEQNIVSKEDVFKHIVKLVNEMKSNF